MVWPVIKFSEQPNTNVDQPMLTLRYWVAFPGGRLPIGPHSLAQEERPGCVWRATACLEQSISNTSMKSSAVLRLRWSCSACDLVNASFSADKGSRVCPAPWGYLTAPWGTLQHHGVPYSTMGVPYSTIGVLTEPWGYLTAPSGYCTLHGVLHNFMKDFPMPLKTSWKGLCR